MDEQTYEDNLSCIKAHYECELEDQDKLLKENDDLRYRLSDALAKLKTYEYINKLKVRDLEKESYFVKLFPNGIGKLVERGISDSCIGLMTRLSARCEQDTGNLIDEYGNFMNKAGLARFLGKDKSNANKVISDLVKAGAIKEKRKWKKVIYQLNDLCFYNGINRANSEVREGIKRKKPKANNE